MSMADVSARKRIKQDNAKIRKIQRELDDHFLGSRVRLTQASRGQNSRRRWKAGAEFIIYHLLVEGREVQLWLSRLDSSPPSFELSVWMDEIEFLPKGNANATSKS